MARFAFPFALLVTLFAISGTALANAPTPGALLHFDFAGLVPESRVAVTIRGGNSGGGAFIALVSGSAPNLEVGPNELRFTAPIPEPGHDFVTASFTVGAYLQEDTVLEMQGPESAAVSIRLEYPSASIFLTAGRRASFPLSGVPFGCFEAGRLGFQQPCPRQPVTHAPLGNFGPILGRFLCCRADPFPPGP